MTSKGNVDMCNGAVSKKHGWDQFNVFVFDQQVWS